MFYSCSVVETFADKKYFENSVSIKPSDLPIFIKYPKKIVPRLFEHRVLSIFPHSIDLEKSSIISSLVVESYKLQ